MNPFSPCVRPQRNFEDYVKNPEDRPSSLTEKNPQKAGVVTAYHLSSLYMRVYPEAEGALRIASGGITLKTLQNPLQPDF
jgi:hypothetical protein